MSDLGNALKVALADTFVMMTQASLIVTAL